MAAKNEVGFSAEERAAMKDHIKEQKAAAKRAGTREAEEKALLEKVAEMPEPDRSMAARIHEIVKANAPDLWPKLWYGMPSYARDGKVVLFFQAADKFKARYATLGFNDTAALDDGNFWPTSFAVKELTPAEEKKIAALVKKAAG